MLETARAATYVPGSNLRSPSAGGAWLFLLPRLSFTRIVCVGLVPGPTLDALCRVGREVIVICSGRAAVRKARGVLRRRRLPRARAIGWSDWRAVPQGSADLVVISSARKAKRLRENETWPEVARLLRTDGVVYLETRGKLERVEGAVGGGGWLAKAGQQSFSIAPGFGEVRAAVVADDAETVGDLRHRGMWATSAFIGIGGRVREVPTGPLGRRLGPRWAVLSGLGVTGWLGRAPRYLRELASEQGIALDPYRWGMAAPGLYLSNKVVFMFFDRASGSPAYVVKATRDASMNGRLMNEWSALSHLRDRNLAEDDAVPRPAFIGTPGGLAVLGVTGIAGRRFADVEPGDVASSSARSAVEWLTELGAVTAEPIAGGPAEAAADLADLFTRFSEIYTLSPQNREALYGHIDRLSSAATPFPSVFQHGDPGAWNLLVKPSGGVAFLDWEAAEPRGAPLWDLFHMMRSFATLASRTAGRKDPLAAFAEHFLADTTSNAFLVESTARYCERVGLAAELVEPLFYGCWMHRALKESTRIPPQRLDGGHYLNLLRRCLDANGEAPLRRLFSLDVSPARR
jgi:hypothetical protein